MSQILPRTNCRHSKNNEAMEKARKRINSYAATRTIGMATTTTMWGSGTNVIQPDQTTNFEMKLDYGYTTAPCNTILC
jgi:hypothetical protein